MITALLTVARFIPQRALSTVASRAVRVLGGYRRPAGRSPGRPTPPGGRPRRLNPPEGAERGRDMGRGRGRFAPPGRRRWHRRLAGTPYPCGLAPAARTPDWGVTTARWPPNGRSGLQVGVESTSARSLTRWARKQSQSTPAAGTRCSGYGPVPVSVSPGRIAGKHPGFTGSRPADLKRICMSKRPFQHSRGTELWRAGTRPWTALTEIVRTTTHGNRILTAA